VQHLRGRRYDIVHTHTVKPGLLGRVTARMAGVPIVMHTVHGFHYWDHMSGLEKWVFLNLERFAAHFCDLLLSQNREDMELAIQEHICPTEKMRFLGNGIDIRSFHPDLVDPATALAKRRELGISPGDGLVGMIGRMVPVKGYREYMQAARVLRERGAPVKFLAIGASQEGAKMISPQKLIEQYGLNGTMQYLGWRDDIRELMAAMDLFVLASYAEGIPRGLMEAAAMGKPTIGTNVRGTREVILDGITGHIVPPRNALALADAIHRMFADPGHMQEMGRQARQHAEEYFDERRCFWRTDMSYRDLVKARISGNRLQWLKDLPPEANRMAV
jgi:glycosyltransferase involved in cell wall biosynthesis